MTGGVDIRDGSVYLPATIADRYFDGVDCVALLIRDGALMMLPLHQAAAGGCLLKVRNAARDRVVSAPDLFEAQGLGGWRASDLSAIWSAEQQGLLIEFTHTKFAN